MCELCREYEDMPKIGCDLTILDETGNITTLNKHEHLYYDHELSQIANWFKYLVQAMGYEWVKEVTISSGDKEFSSEDC